MHAQVAKVAPRIRRRDFLHEWTHGVAAMAVMQIASRVQGNDKPPVSRPAGFSDKTLANIEDLVPKLMRNAHVPGVSMSVVREGKLVWQRGFGVKDAASNEPVDDQTVFEAASMSKPVFAYVVMKLCEKGVIELDTPLTKYAPERFLEGDARLDLITTRHVLSHTTGFRDWRSKENPLKIHFTPGSQFDYSGEGYFYLQSVVSHLVGHTNPQVRAKYECDLEVCATDIDQTMRRMLLTPFGMTASGYVWNEFIATHYARPHDADGKPLVKAKTTATDAARYASSGGLQTTAGDYAKFLIEVVDPKPADEFRLNRPMWTEMLRPQIKLAKGQEIDGASAWALGWAIQQRPTGNVILHSGGQTGFRSLTMASVERKSGFVILTNSDNGAKICYDLTLGGLLTPLLAG